MFSSRMCYVFHMGLKRLVNDGFQIWLLVGIVWVVGTVVFAGIRQEHGTGQLRWVQLPSGVELPPTPEQLQRRERILLIKQTELILTRGSVVYAVLGLLFFRRGIGKVLTAGAIVFFATTLIAGWTKTCEHFGANEHGYRGGQLIGDAIGVLMFAGPLGVFLLAEMNARRSECPAHAQIHKE